MGLFDDAVPGGNIAKPIMIALGALLVSKMLAGKSEPDQASLNPQPLPPAGTPDATPDGGLLGGLGGLLDKLKNGGLADAADSWVGTGQNKPVQPGQLGSALGQQTISDLAKPRRHERAGTAPAALAGAARRGRQDDAERPVAGSQPDRVDVRPALKALSE